MLTMKYNITFIGHMCYDEIVPFQGQTTVSPGSAVLCGAMVAGRIGQNVAVITKMSPEDSSILKPMEEVGIDTVPSAFEGNDVYASRASKRRCRYT